MALPNRKEFSLKVLQHTVIAQKPSRLSDVSDLLQKFSATFSKVLYENLNNALPQESIELVSIF